MLPLGDGDCHQAQVCNGIDLIRILLRTGAVTVKVSSCAVILRPQIPGNRHRAYLTKHVEVLQEGHHILIAGIADPVQDRCVIKGSHSSVIAECNRFVKEPLPEFGCLRIHGCVECGVLRVRVGIGGAVRRYGLIPGRHLLVKCFPGRVGIAVFVIHGIEKVVIPIPECCCSEHGVRTALLLCRSLQSLIFGNLQIPNLILVLLGVGRGCFILISECDIRDLIPGHISIFLLFLGIRRGGLSDMGVCNQIPYRNLLRKHLNCRCHSRSYHGSG